MSKPHNGYHIKCPKTGKALSVSRDVYHALEHAQEITKKQQTDLGQKIKQSGQALIKKQYLGSSKDIDIAVRFDEAGKVDPTVELKNSLEFLDEKTRRIVEDTIYQFTICMNQALESKSKDLEAELKSTFQPAA